MNSLQYRDYILNLDKILKIDTNYHKTISRQLSIFSTKSKKIFYIESKTQRIMLDYSIHDTILWNNNVTGKVQFNKKNEVSFSKYFLDRNFDFFLYDIPYFMALQYYKFTKNQSLFAFEFLDWLNFFTKKFFDKNIPCNNNIELVIDTASSFELKACELYKLIDVDSIKFESNDFTNSFIGLTSSGQCFYILIRKRHYLFKINN